MIDIQTDESVLPLKLRALLRLIEEANSWGAEVDGSAVETKSKAPKTSDICRYHATTSRDGVEGFGQWLASDHKKPGAYHNWCASVISWAESVASKNRPPGRASVREFVEDAQQGLRGRILTASDVRSGKGYPPPGSKAVIKRPGGLHIESVIFSTPNGYYSLGGNEISKPGVFHAETRKWNDPLIEMFIDCDAVSDSALHTFGYLLGVATLDQSLWKRGIDVSLYNHPSRFDLEKLDVDFAIFRASFGDKTDECASEHRSNFQQAGVVNGAYSWLDQRKPPTDQVDRFLFDLERLGVGAGDVIPHIDVEPLGGKELDVGWWRDALPDAIERVASIYGECGIYTNRKDAALLGYGPWSERPLWLASHTTASSPKQPGGWRTWRIWQHAGDAHPNVPAGTLEAYADGKQPIDLNWARDVKLIQ